MIKCPTVADETDEMFLGTQPESVAVILSLWFSRNPIAAPTTQEGSGQFEIIHYWTTRSDHNE